MKYVKQLNNVKIYQTDCGYKLRSVRDKVWVKECSTLEEAEDFLTLNHDYIERKPATEKRMYQRDTNYELNIATKNYLSF